MDENETFKNMNDFETVMEYYKYCNENKIIPKCPKCNEPLTIIQHQDVDICWNWNGNNFTKSEDTDTPADRPYCEKCEYSDWDFIDYNYVNF